MNWDNSESIFAESCGGLQEELGMLTDRQLESVVARHDPPASGLHENFSIEGEDAEAAGDDFAVEDFEVVDLPARFQ